MPNKDGKTFIRLPLADKAATIAEAEAEHISEAEYIRRALELYRSITARAREAGVPASEYIRRTMAGDLAAQVQELRAQMAEMRSVMAANLAHRATMQEAEMGGIPEEWGEEAQREQADS
jgi:hypothetical protein